MAFLVSIKFSRMFYDFSKHRFLASSPRNGFCKLHTWGFPHLLLDIPVFYKNLEMSGIQLPPVMNYPACSMTWKRGCAIFQFRDSLITCQYWRFLVLVKFYRMFFSFWNTDFWVQHCETVLANCPYLWGASSGPE